MWGLGFGVADFGVEGLKIWRVSAVGMLRDVYWALGCCFFGFGILGLSLRYGFPRHWGPSSGAL